MSGQNHFSEKCVCGAEITLTATFGFIDTSEIKKRFEQWQHQHSNCIPLFHQVQEAHMAHFQLSEVK